MARNFNKRNGAGAKGAAEVLNYSATGKLVHWVDPMASGVVLGGGLAFLVALSFCSSISILANLLLLAVVGGLGSKMYVHLMGMLKKPCKDPLVQLALVDLTIPTDCPELQSFVTSSVESFNQYASSLRSLLLAEDMYASLKFGLVLYIFTFIGSIFNTLTLLILTWIAAFIFPKVYEDNQDSMDDLYYKVVDQYAALDAKVAALFPVQPAKEAQKVEEEKEE